MKAGGVLLGVGAMFWVTAGSARADDLQGGLAGLDAAMKGTGRVGALAPRSELPIGPGTIPDGQARGKTPQVAAGGDRPDEYTLLPQPAGTSELDYLKTEGPVANCRIEVARRRRVAPAQVSAGSVVLRFTIEPSGRVRNAEAVWAANTDLEVAACAKRVLSEWTFPKHAAGDLHVEHLYRLTGVRSMNRRNTSLAAVSQ